MQESKDIRCILKSKIFSESGSGKWEVKRTVKDKGKYKLQVSVRK